MCLAVEKVNQCHTHASVDLALQEFPVRMDPLYNRMALSIANIPTLNDKSLATKILQCLLASFRVLKVAELSQALGVPEVLDLQRTAMDLCGGFVVVDNGGHVVMIHRTARDYLLNDTGEGCSFNIDRQAAHRQMFLSSMQCLMSTGLRASLGRSQKPEFLEYAASFWLSHLVSSPCHDHDTAMALKKFLRGKWILTWIHALAVTGKLRVLVRASKDLLRFASMAHQQDPGKRIGGIADFGYELLESWAVDLLRIAGKFDGLLLLKPDSIYKLIPPFCPKSSSVYQLFGKLERKSLSVTGLSAEIWDDALTRVTIGQGTGMLASSIAAAGSQVAVLVSSGSVFLYNSSNLWESAASPIKHGERVYMMRLNSTATLLATYGYRTIKVWDVSTGKCRVSVEGIESRARPLAILFVNNNSKLLVGAEDRIIRSLNLDEEQPTWEIEARLDEDELEVHLINSATHVALNKDGSMVAIAYRNHPLSVWETDGPSHIGHCRRKDETVAIRELSKLFGTRIYQRFWGSISKASSLNGRLTTAKSMSYLLWRPSCRLVGTVSSLPLPIDTGG